jgi:hypothetical protein
VLQLCNWVITWSEAEARQTQQISNKESSAADKTIYEVKSNDKTGRKDK